MNSKRGGRVLIATTGGTIDKVYFDARSRYEVGDSVVGNLLRQAQVRVPYRIVCLMRKDSLDLSDADRQRIRDAIAAEPERRVIVTHGTDTMVDTARALQSLGERIIVLTGSLAPARFAETDAWFNVGLAFAAVQILDPGVYVAMNGEIFPADRVRKDRSLNAFVRVPD
jgi:L-asparaginase